MGLANKLVVLYRSIKIGKKWTLRHVCEDSSHFSDGAFYVSWYDSKKKQMDPVGRDPEHALRMANLKRAALAYISAGGEVKNTNPNQNAVQEVQSPVQDRKSVSTAISTYLEDCLDQQGKSGPRKPTSTV